MNGVPEVPSVHRIEAEETRRRVDTQILIFESLRQRSTGMLALIAGSAYVKIAGPESYAGTGYHLAFDLVLGLIVATVYMPTWDISYGFPPGLLLSIETERQAANRPELNDAATRDEIVWRFVGDCWQVAFEENERHLRFIRSIMIGATYGWVFNTSLWLLVIAMKMSG